MVSAFFSEIEKGSDHLVNDQDSQYVSISLCGDVDIWDPVYGYLVKSYIWHNTHL